MTGSKGLRIKGRAHDPLSNGTLRSSVSPLVGEKNAIKGSIPHSGRLAFSHSGRRNGTNASDTRHNTLYTLRNTSKRHEGLIHSCTIMHHSNSIFAFHSLYTLHSITQTQPFTITSTCFHSCNFHQSPNPKIHPPPSITTTHHLQLLHFVSIISIPFATILFTTSSPKNTSNLFPQIPLIPRDITPFILTSLDSKDTDSFSPPSHPRSSHLSISIYSMSLILFIHIYTSKIHLYYHRSFREKHNSSMLILRFSLQTFHLSTNTNTHLQPLSTIPSHFYHLLLFTPFVSNPSERATHFRQVLHLNTPSYSICTLSLRNIHSIHLYTPFYHFQTSHHWTSHSLLYQPHSHLTQYERYETSNNTFLPPSLSRFIEMKRGWSKWRWVKNSRIQLKWKMDLGG